MELSNIKCKARKCKEFAWSDSIHLCQTHYKAAQVIYYKQHPEFKDKQNVTASELGRMIEFIKHLTPTQF